MYDTGSTAFMLVCTMLVLLMTPGLSFFYGGLSRRKNVVNTMLMSFAVIGIVGLTWVLVGWSLAYGGDGSNPVIGGLDQLGLSGVVGGMLDEAQVADGSSYPSVVDVTFQMAFALITTAIITKTSAATITAIITTMNAAAAIIMTTRMRNGRMTRIFTSWSARPAASI